MKSVGTIFKNSRLLARTIDNIGLESDNIDFYPFRVEGKLLCSSEGSCLLSATLLVKGEHVPTYGFNGRRYGFLFDAEKCNVYGVNSIDANTTRESKVKKRQERKGINLLTSNSCGIKSLDELSDAIKLDNQSCLNEIEIDAWMESCVGLFVRYSEKADRYYYQSLLEIKLVQKYLIQTFGFSESLQICLYDEKNGRLLKFPSEKELINYANFLGLTKRNYPGLFELLDPGYQFKKFMPPLTLEEYLKKNQWAEEIVRFKDQFIASLLQVYQPFGARETNEESIFLELVDNIIGIPESMIQEIFESYYPSEHVVNNQKEYSNSRFFSISSPTSLSQEFSLPSISCSSGETSETR